MIQEAKQKQQQPIGDVLDGRYEILECLGSGGMGVVYKARQKQLERIVAIKMPHLSNISSTPARNRFEREARTMAKFSHENIVQVYDYNAKGDRPYIVLEYVQGQELADLLAQSNAISVGGVLNLCRQIANGLDYAHKHGVIHRDIKPENIVISDKRRCVKIMDFGLVRIEGTASQDTRAGFVVGTPQYMSPEQVRARPVGPSSDIYSFAVILYCIFTGRLPFEGDGMALMMRHATEQPADPLSINPFLPENVGQALLRSLSKDLEARHPTALALVEDIAYGLRDRAKLPYSALLRGEWDTSDVPMVSELMLGALDEAAEVDGAPSGTGEAGRLVLAVPDKRQHALNDLLIEAGYQVHSTRKAAKAIDYVLRYTPDAVLVDESLIDMSGASLCRLLRANPMTEKLPLIYMGERGELHLDHLASTAPVQVIPGDEAPDRVCNFVNLLLKRIREAKSKHHGTTEKLHTSEPGQLLAPFLKRLDRALVRENATQSLLWTGLKSDELHATFDQLSALLRPILPHRNVYCAMFSGRPGEPGTLLFGHPFSADKKLPEAVHQAIDKEIRGTARNHKDLPEQFDVVYARQPAAGDGERSDEKPTAPLFTPKFVSFPVEEGPRLFGVFGLVCELEDPQPAARDTIKELAALSFAIISSAWQRRQLSNLRDRDEISGVWRRSQIIDYLRLSLANSNALEEPFSVMMLDLDHLDSFNETLGMAGGDRILREVGSLLEALGPDSWRAGRIGSDEFLLVMPGASIAEALRECKAMLQRIGGIRLSELTDDLKVTASAGIGFRALEEKSADYLVRTARNGLMAVKAGGGNSIRAAG